MSDYDLSRPVLARLREAADIVTVVGERVTLRRAGRNYVGLCPFHGEKTPSFSVSREKGTFYCFGCKRGGDVIDFVAELDRLTFVEAVETLARRFGIELPLSSPQAQQRRREEDALLEALEAAQAHFSRRLADDRPRAFLEARGVSLELAATFGLGYATADWSTLFDELHRRFSERVLIASGLVVEGEGGRRWDRFRDRITIPIRLARGTLVAFGGRAVGDDHPKYLNSPETALFSKSHVLFALDRALRTFGERRRAVVVEGYFDCMAMHAAGVTETVATLGTALTEHHARELARRCERVVVCYDGDQAGRAAAVHAVRALLACELDVAVVLLPGGMDPDDIIRRQGAAAMRQLLASAMAPAEFLLAHLGATREERRSGLRSALAVADVCPDPVRRFQIREALAQGCGIPVDQLGQIEAPRPVTVAPDPVSLPPPGELALLRCLLVDAPPTRRRDILARIPLEALEHPVTRRVIERLAAAAADQRALEISDLMSDIEEGDARRVLAALDYEAPETPENRLELILRELCQRHRLRKLAALNHAIRQAEARNDQEALVQLSHEWKKLQR